MSELRGGAMAVERPNPAAVEVRLETRDGELVARVADLTVKAFTPPAEFLLWGGRTFGFQSETDKGAGVPDPRFVLVYREGMAVAVLETE